jgi:hypothetical protein
MRISLKPSNSGANDSPDTTGFNRSPSMPLVPVTPPSPADIGAGVIESSVQLTIV